MEGKVKKILLSSFIVVLSLTVAMSLFLAGCKTTTTETTTTAATTAAAATTVAETTAAASVATTVAQNVDPSTGIPKGDWVIAYVDGYIGNAWRAAHYKGFVDAAEDMKKRGLIKDYMAAQNADVDSEIATVNDYINQGVDALCIENDYGNALGASIQKALDKGIVVVTTGAAGLTVTEDGNLILIQADNVEYMKAPTEYIAWKMDYKGNLVHIYGLEDSAWVGIKIRRDAIMEVLNKFPDINIIAKAPARFTNSVAYDAMTSLLNTYGDQISGKANGVIAEDVGLGILQAYTAAGKAFPCLSGDYTFGFLREIKKNPDLVAVSTCYPPGTSWTYLHAAILKLNGYKMDPAKTVVYGAPNSILCPAPGVIVRDQSEVNDAWTKNLAPTTKVWLLDDVLNENQSKTDNDCFDAHLDIEKLMELFYLPKS
jgi:ABC-type sugar transport system, periplasmic component